MKLLNNFTVAFLLPFLLLSFKAEACSDEQRVDNLIAKTNCDHLIIGDENKTDDNNLKYLTLTDIEEVFPHLSLDWKQKAPSFLHNKFSLIFMNNLSLDELENTLCIKNALNCLKLGGMLAFNYKRSPFCQEEGSLSTLKKIEKKYCKLTKDKKELETKFYKLTGFEEGQNFTKDEFDSQVKKNPKIKDTLFSYEKIKNKINKLEQEKLKLQKKYFYAAPSNINQSQLKNSHSKIESYLGGMGFKIAVQMNCIGTIFNAPNSEKNVIIVTKFSTDDQNLKN